MRFSMARVLALTLALILGGVSEGSALLLSDCPDCRGEEQTTRDACTPCVFCSCCTVRAPASPPAVCFDRPPATFVLVQCDRVEAVEASPSYDIFHPPRA